MADTMQCKCVSPFQDSRYGKGMRVVTRAKDGAPRCTVCGGKARSEERVRLHWQGPGAPEPITGLPLNPRLCTDNRMLRK